MMLDVHHNTCDADFIKQKSEVAIICRISKILGQEMFQGTFWFSQTAPGSTRGTLLGVAIGTGPSFKPVDTRLKNVRDECVLTHAEMIQRLVKDGLSVSMLAEIFNVTRPTIYHWQNETEPQADKQSRIELIFNLLSSVDTKKLSLMSKVWNRSIGEGLSLFEILTSKEPQKNEFNNALSAVDPLFQKLLAKGNVHRKSVADLVEETLSAGVPILQEWEQMRPVGQEIV